MKPSLVPLLLASLFPALLGAGTAHAGEAEIRAAIAASFPGTNIVSISKAPLAGMFEVVVDGDQGPVVVYADDAGRHVLIGDLLSLADKRNLTRERMDKLLEVKWDSLPFNNAIKLVKGNGKRQFAVFSDPDCPFCKKAEQEFAKLDNVTIHIFAYPLPMHADAPRKARLVWCSKDRAAAWQDLMLRGKLPTGKDDCKNPIEDNLALGARLRIEGTPAMIFPNGKRIPGFVDAARLEAMLDGAQVAKR